MLIFKDRIAAGKVLAGRLLNYLGKKETTVVLAIPRGGVIVAAEVSRELKLPLDIVITRKIGVPGQPELALGAVDPSGNVVWDTRLLQDLGYRITDLSFEIEEQLQEIKRREKVYRGDRQPYNLKGKEVILVDDGIATGATIISAIKYLKKIGVKKIIVGVPVVAEEIADKISQVVDELIALSIPDYLGAVGRFYEDFKPVEDIEVSEILKKHASV